MDEHPHLVKLLSGWGEVRCLRKHHTDGRRSSAMAKPWMTVSLRLSVRVKVESSSDFSFSDSVFSSFLSELE